MTFYINFQTINFTYDVNESSMTFLVNLSCTTEPFGAKISGCNSLSWKWKNPMTSVDHWRQTTAHNMFRETALNPYFFKKVIRKPNPMKIMTCTSWNTEIKKSWSINSFWISLESIGNKMKNIYFLFLFEYQNFATLRIYMTCPINCYLYLLTHFCLVEIFKRLIYA